MCSLVRLDETGAGDLAASTSHLAAERASTVINLISSGEINIKIMMAKIRYLGNV